MTGTRRLAVPAPRISPAEYARRSLLAAGCLSAQKLDALLVSSLANVRYLTGFTGDRGLALLLKDGVVLLVDPRFGLQARSEASCAVRVERGPLISGAARLAVRHRVRRLGFEKTVISHQSFLSLDESLSASVRLTPAENLIEPLRAVKSPVELDLIRRSVLTNSQAFSSSLRHIKPGMTEIDLAAELEYRMRRLGAEKPAFESIVAFGRRSAFVHASPSHAVISGNGLLLMDLGVFRDGYASDMTRTVYVGRATQRVRTLYGAVLEAQLAAIDAIREGVTSGSIDRAARRVLRGHGLERLFSHATGHGLGLEIHEMPRLGRGIKTLLQAGMAVTVEPGVYLQKLGGIRIEDTVTVTRTGCDVLTPTTKELITL
jgi:Xaa-Pro aminopeptidase